MHKHKPMFYVFAGNNGSGKSTIRNLLIDKIGVDINIDPDSIARRIDPLNPESKRVSAGKEVIKSVYKHIKEGTDFSLETTLAGGNAIRQMLKAKEQGYKITMFYVALDDVNQNINRVAMRVKNGGHDIPTEDIIRRNKTSFDQLYRYAHIIDTLVMIDNSLDDGKIILEVNNGFITFETNYLPQWALPVMEQFKLR
ncbi:MAG TPA: zeta toxin family protein [Candidatus Avamphibacillus sp.]|nr:zeta toxin family protein [Candidatus Avamphibacillus sp.]